MGTLNLVMNILNLGKVSVRLCTFQKSFGGS